MAPRKRAASDAELATTQKRAKTRSQKLRQEEEEAQRLVATAKGKLHSFSRIQSSSSFGRFQGSKGEGEKGSS